MHGCSASLKDVDIFQRRWTLLSKYAASLGLCKDAKDAQRPNCCFPDANVPVTDLLEKAANIGDVDSARSLMNLVMQFRKVGTHFFEVSKRKAIDTWNFKVCNHPELFERADVVAPFSFCKFGRSGPLMREGDSVLPPYSTRSPIEFSVPTLLYLDGGHG